MRVHELGLDIWRYMGQNCILLLLLLLFVFTLFSDAFFFKYMPKFWKSSKGSFQIYCEKKRVYFVIIF